MTSIKILKQFSTLAFFLLFSAQFVAQENAGKDFLKHTSVVIHKAQKQLIAAANIDAGGNLAKAVLLQTYAVKLFQNRETDASLCFSSAARELASQVIKGTNAADNAYDTVSTEEKKLLKNCRGQDELLAEAKKRMPGMTESDADYKAPRSLNETNIDIK